jgi:hypothetical protein
MTRISFFDRAHRASRAAARVALAAFASLLLMGQTAHAQAPYVDPPGRVARLSDVTGQVWLYGPDSNEWIGVGRNRPLTSGDRIATDNDARADIALGTTTLRLDAATELEVVQLDDAHFVVHLHKGSAAVRIRSAAAATEFVLETDEGSFRAQAAGRYRFDRLEQASDVTVLAGRVVFEGLDSALPVTAGQHAQFWLDAGGAPQYAMLQPVRDAFTAFVDARDRAEDRVAAVRYVSPEMTGADDLDRYGQWEQTPEYGAIWTPREVAVGWAPYSTGRWAWVRPWGWTWVDEAPWGFAPFHYGRWVYYRDSWGWAPGTYVARPVYAPALVAWMGGPRLSVSINIGGGQPVGWFPLAPREVYVPSYRSSPGYVRNINVTNVTNVTNITTIVNNRNGEADRRDFANRRWPNAVTVVPASVITGRQAVGPSAAQFRSDPRVRAFVSEARPGSTMAAPPVAAPSPATPPADGRGAPRPPFEGRAPGGFGGRGDSDRRPEAGRTDGTRGAPPPAAVTSPGARPTVAAQEPTAIGRPPRGAIGREPVAVEPEPSTRVAAPSPVRRGAPIDEAFGRPGVTIKERRPLPEAASTQPQAVRPIQPPQSQSRPVPEVPRVVPMQSVPSPQAVQPVQPIQPVPRMEPRAVVPRAVVPRAAEPPRAPQAERAPPVDQRVARPEPRVREERREPRDDKQPDKREPGDKQR